MSPPSDVYLPGDWWLRHVLDAAGRRVIEVYDCSRDLVALVASTARPFVSIDAAWRGLSQGAAGERQWWALAVGHARRDSDLLVTFTTRAPRGDVRRVAVAPDVVDGLWVATVSGRPQTVTLRQARDHRVCRVSPTFRGRP